MADNTPDPLNPAENNDAVKKKLQEQGDINPNPNDIDIRHSQDALDTLAAEKTKEKEVEGEPAPDKDKPVVGGETPPVSDDAAAKAKAEADAKAAAEKKASDDAALKKSEDIFKDTPQLPQGASPKSAEAFASVKIKAAQEISKLEQDRDTLKQENEELKKRIAANKPLTPETEKEIEDLRAFRNRLDVEADPKFKEFNKQVSSAQEFIYAQLKKSPVVTDSVIDEIKKHGGPDMVDLSKLFEKIKDPTLQRLVESKVADIEQAKWNREEAIKSAKANIGQYVKEREQAAEKAATAHRDATKAELDNLRATNPGLSWLKEQVIDPKADDETKKRIGQYNEFVADINKQLEQSIQDDSPQMRAIMVAGMGQLLYLQRVHEAQTKKLENIEAEHKKSVEGKDKEIADLKKKIDAFKGASISRLRESGAPASGKLPAVTSTSIDTRPGDALDAAAKAVMEEKQARGK